MTVVRIGQPKAVPRRSLLTRPATPGMVVLVVLAIIAFRIWLVETAIVEGDSMERTLLPADRVLVVKLMGVKRFDVVVLTDPQANETVIKRVVGFPGDTVSMVPRVVQSGGRELVGGSQLYINGQPYDEPYAISALPTVLDPVKLGDDSYYVLGDNRDDSIDSRVYGPVDRKLIHGVGVLVCYPFGRLHMISRTAGPAAPDQTSAPSSTAAEVFDTPR